LCNVDVDLVDDDVHTPKFLNTITTLGLPNHKLGLKLECKLYVSFILSNAKAFKREEVCGGKNVLILSNICQFNCSLSWSLIWLYLMLKSMIRLWYFGLDIFIHVFL